ncbi:MAG TPA: hypothetical protein DEF00_02585 [Candidatus Taylorbacteria bacterium]|nr:hypothetical protein [Candidatus Taylorbacteria bacterium]
MKTVYFVRHGQSEGNVGSVFQHADSPLTAKGIKQAEFIAERCTRLPIDVIISSTQPRAADTAQIISENTKHEVEFSDLFRERKKPRSLEGKFHNDAEARKINEAWWNSLAGSGPRVEDGESFDDLRDRAGKALAFLSNRAEDNLLVVTHGFFLRYLVASAIFGEHMQSIQFQPLMRTLRTENTGVTVLRYDSPRFSEEIGPHVPWVLVTWNDHAHLG